MFEYKPQRTAFMPWGPPALITVSILLLAAIGSIIFLITELPNSNNNNSNKCTTPACIEVADTILSSIDDSVDPCDDFYEYACGGWRDKHDWQLSRYSMYNNLYDMRYDAMETVLDTLYYHTDNDIINHTSIIKAKTFYSSCYHSEVTEESITESDLLQEFLLAANFSNNYYNYIDYNDTNDGISMNGDNSSSSSSSNYKWNEMNIKLFNEAMGWLSVRNWNYLFTISGSSVISSNGYATITQNYDVWLFYNSTSFKNVVFDTYVPLFESYFGLDSNDAKHLGTDICDLADQISSISTVSMDLYYDASLLAANQKSVSLGNLSAVFHQSGVLNITQILFETFESKDVSKVYYYEPDVSYFNNLTNLLSNSDPVVVQYYIYTTIFLYGLDFEDSYEHSRLLSRSEFCYAQLLQHFPIVFGHIMSKTLYTNDTYKAVYDLATTVANDGMTTVVEDAIWMDTSSMEDSLSLIERMDFYIGLPPKIKNSGAVDKYYANLTQESGKFLDNLGDLLHFEVYLTQSDFDDTTFDIWSPWQWYHEWYSSIWLTSVNAFYIDGYYEVTIPASISTKPFFDKDYPSAINFGSLGSVVGHEMTHGFDADSFIYKYYWSDYTKNDYDEISQCFIDQYDNFEVESGVFVNGTRTLSENIADNGGVSASYAAWRRYVNENGGDDNVRLPGVDMSPKQMFYWSWAQTWCSAFRNGYYDGYNGVHGPMPARVWGVVQNSEEFANAYGCAEGTPMNPVDKCVLW